MFIFDTCTAHKIKTWLYRIDKKTHSVKFYPFVFSLLILLTADKSFAQITFPIDIHDGQTIETCNGFFTDSSLGDPDEPYGPNEDYQVTFVSADPGQEQLTFYFEVFQLGQGDVLYVYDGSDESAPLLIEATLEDLSDDTLYSSTGSMHFRFVSDDFDADDPDALAGRVGWLAVIGCVNVCDLFEAYIDPLDGLMHCPGSAEAVSFAASAGYFPDNIEYDPEAFVYTWTIEGQEIPGQELTHFFPAPGAYTVWLSVSDTETGCVATAHVVLMVATIPSFTGTMASVETACANENFILYGVANPTPWTGFPTSVEEEVPFLIGLESAYLYESTLEFDVFQEGVEVLSAEDFDLICVHVEHVDQSQLMFELESPAGTIVQLKAYGGPTANLGEPVVWDDHIPGDPYAYCFSPFPQYGNMAVTTPQFHEYTDNAGNYYFNAAHMPPGNYTPDESLNDFAGSPMNGAWTLRVEDQTIGESGHVFGWGLLFDAGFYPDSLIFVPEIIQEQWFQNGDALSGNPAAASVAEPGDHQFLFEITDNFGCTYDTTLTVHILPLPEAEITSELEIPICEGDSTLLTVHPINHDGLDWEYQWQVGGVDMPGRTYDTLMVKDPGVYSVMITDTNTGCIDFFEKEITDQNCDLTIPNVFTPNADGINDEFEIKNLEHYPNAHMVIYNRWGKKVFEHNDYYNNWWDGANVPDGTYYYVLRYTRMGKTRYTEGTVTIIR